jgi:hypothetical protein
MNSQPPFPRPRKRRRLAPILIAGAVLVTGIVTSALVVGVHLINKYGITEPIDSMFGDQSLKSTVALLELHKLRFGHYPESLRELKYAGDWDQIWLSGMRYYASNDKLTYYVEVERGWIAKPTLVIPDEFWQNTGYDRNLKPKK